MLALPIARRELLVLARAPSTWQGRLASSAVVFFFGIGFAVIFNLLGQRAITQPMQLLGTGLSLVCLFSGVTLTADAIAQEKREGTLGLLFLTHLSSFEIVVGKLLAHTTAGFYAVLCAMPLLSISMLAGGMSLRQVFMYLIWALNVLFFSAAVGLVASAICRDKKKAQTLGSLIVLFFWMGLPLLALLLKAFGGSRWAIEALTRLSVNLPPTLNPGPWRLLPSTSVAWSLVCTHTLAWMFLGLTVWLLRRRWQDQSAGKRRSLRELWKRISVGGPTTRMKLRRKLLDRNAFMWLASRDRLQTASVWLVAVSLLTLVMLQLMLQLSAGPGLLIGITLAISMMLQLAFSGAAGAQLLREYEQGTLELVFSTPLAVHEVLRGQFDAARRQYRTLFGFTFVLLWIGIAWVAWLAPGRRFIGITVLAVYSGLLLLNFYALGWVGMWSVVKGPDPKKTHANAFFLIVIFPGLIFGMILACANFLNWLVGNRFSVGPELPLAMLFLLVVGNCIYWLRRAKRELPLELRQFAFRRYAGDERPNVFTHLGRLAGRWFRSARATSGSTP